ncbi:hypothetical protein PTTG_28037 [Puccinia triticina 1-1 BBBD Race 1]|uniref:Uncharacterized protein n=1 Tax=Puccinia triticina (isolate 1-1 / race 1 (BBBD)) TaxID=630390 RepID=A0A180GF79_PUCT1|nr:hypothetical protein PTTG_28037 [Puccinia triticina 1-1 BBBD Race 1]
MSVGKFKQLKGPSSSTRQTEALAVSEQDAKVAISGDAENALALKSQRSPRKLFDDYRQRLKGLSSQVQTNLMNTFQKVRTKIIELVHNFQAAVMKLANKSKQLSGQALEQLKGKSSRTRQAKTLEASELEAKVPKRPLSSQLKERFRIRVKNPRRPPTSEEKADFDRFKFDIARAFDDEKYGYRLGDGEEFTPKNLGKLIDNEMHAKTIGHTLDGTPIITKQSYGGYLEDLRVFTKSDDALTNAKTVFTSLESLEEAPNKAQIVEDVTKVIKQLDEQKLSQFAHESESALETLRNIDYEIGLRKPLAEYFKAQAIDVQKFAAARAIQMNPERLLDLAKPLFTTAEEVMHTLPAELDLTTELYSYSLIRGIEEVLSEARLATQPAVERLANIHMADAFKDNNAATQLVADYINKMGETDFQRLTGENPSKIFQELQKTNRPDIQQRYIDNQSKRS